MALWWPKAHKHSSRAVLRGTVKRIMCIRNFKKQHRDEAQTDRGVESMAGDTHQSRNGRGKPVDFLDQAGLDGVQQPVGRAGVSGWQDLALSEPP